MSALDDMEQAPALRQRITALSAENVALKAAQEELTLLTMKAWNIITNNVHGVEYLELWCDAAKKYVFPTLPAGEAGKPWPTYSPLSQSEYK